MNKIFKVIWSKSKQCYIVVSEMAKNHSGKKKIVVVSILAAMAVGSETAVVEVQAGAFDGGQIGSYYATAIGYKANAFTDSSIAIGTYSYSKGTQVPGDAGSTVDPSIAIGNKARAVGNSALAVGMNATADNSFGVAVGRNTEVTGDYGVGIGFKSKAALHGIGIGEQARALKEGATTLGVSSRGYGKGAIAIGWQSLAGADVYTAGVPGNDINKDSSSKIDGYNNWGDMSVGLRALATGGNATALGRNAAATAANAVAIGGGNGNSFNDNTERTLASGEKSAAIGYNSAASGTSASALGTKASASAENAAAIGTSASASAKDTFAAGSSAAATAEGATAVGKAAKAQKADATSLGSGAIASEVNATALGKGATASKADATAVGSGATASEANAVAIGKDAEASKGNAIAIGKEAEARETSATAIGDGANAEKANAVAIGKGAISGGTSGIAVGNDAQAQAVDTIAVGSSSRASNANDNAFGNAAQATGGGSTAIGYTVNASGNQSFGAGSNTAVSGSAAVGIGYKVTASGDRAISIGNNDGNNTTSATASYTVAIGSGTTAGGSGAVAIGKNVQNAKEYTTAIGMNLTVSESATASVLLGYNSTTQANQAVNIGSTNTTEKAAQYSTAIGYKAKVGGKNAIAIGSNPDTGNELIASATNSVAIGTSAQAKAEGATALGYGAGATSSNALAFGTSASSSAEKAVALGNSATATANSAVAIGDSAQSKANHSVAIGTNAKVLAGQGNVALGWGTEIGNDDVSLSNKVPDAQKTYAYLLDKSSEDAANDAGNGIVAIGKKRDSNDGQTIARRLTGLAGGVSDYDAVNLKQVKALESNERHIKAKTGNAAYKPDATGTITLNYVNGKGEDVTGETTEITDVAKKSDEWTLRTQDGNTAAVATPQTVNGLTKKAVTLKAGDNIAIENSNGTVTIKAKNVVTSISSGNSTALTVNPSNGAVTITPNIASSVGAANEDGKLVTSGVVKTALDLKVNKTDELHVKPGNYTVGNDGDVSLIQENANSQAQNNKAFTIKDVAKKSVVDGINTTVNTHTTQISNLTTAVGGKVSQSDFDAFKGKAITFTGDDNAGVARTLDTTLTVKGGANYTSTTANTNIRVEKDGSNGANGLLVKLSDKLSGMKEIAGNGSDNLVIKNGTNTVTVTPGKGNDKGTVNFGDAKVVASNLEADIAYKAGTETTKKTVKLQTGFDFVAGTGTVAAATPAAGRTTTTSPTANTDGVATKKGIAISTAANGVVNIGLDSDTRGAIDNAADKNLSNLSDAGKDKVKELAKTAAQDAVKVADGINTTVTTDTTTTAGTTIYKVNANDTTVAVTGDGLAITGGDLGTDKVRKYSLDLSDATKAKLKAVDGLATVIGGTTIAANGTVTGPTFSITKADGTSENATTLKDAIDKLNATNVGQNTKISETAGKVTTLEGKVTTLEGKVTDLGTTVTNNYNDLSNKIAQAGTAATTAATTKGLNFTGDDATDTGKVHRDLGETLTIKGGENFTRGANENNIKVVKNDKALDVKLAENLANIKEIAGDGTNDLVIKNGDTKVTVKAPKDGNRGSIDFGDTKLVASNLDASIKYRANDEAAGNAKSVKLADGFNYVASNEATTTAEGPKSGLAIKAEDNGKVTFGLDKATREKVDNAADKNLSNLSDAGKDKVKELAKDAAKTAVKVADGINTTVTTDITTTAGTTIYKVNAIDTTVAVGSDALTINNATPDANKVRAYSVDLSDATKGKLTAVGNLATVIGGTTIAANGTVTGPTFSITKADGTSENATTLKDAIDKLNATNEGQNTKISETAGKVTDLGTTVTNNYNDLSNKITQATTAATTKGLNFTGDDTADNGKVHRDLGETLTIKGGENFTRGANENNIKVVKNDKALDVKLAENLGKIKEIAGDGTHDLVIKNGDTKVTVKAPKDGNTGSIDFGDTKLVASNLDASIKYRANDEATGNAKSVKLADGFNYVASNDATTTAEGPKSGLAIKAEDNGKITFGLDKATRTTLDNAASKEYVENALTNLNSTITGNANLNFAGNVTKDAQNKAADKIGLALATGTLHVNGDNTNIVTTAKGNTITVELAQAVKDQLAKVGDAASNGRDGKDGVSGAKGLTGADGLNNATLNDKVNALRNGEAGSVVYTNEAGDRVVKAKDGKYYKAEEVKTDGTVKTAAENNNKEPQAVENPQARVVNGNGDTKTATTLSNIADGKVGANSKEAVNGGQLHTVKSDLATALGGDSKVNTDGSFTGPTYNITKDDGTNATEPVKNVGDAISKLDTRINNANSTLSTKGLDFYGNKDIADTDKVHRNLGEALKVKGAENFARAEGAKNNIDVVKNAAGDGFDVKLAENLANMKEIAGDGTHDLVIKNGDTKVTVKAPKAGNTGSIDFGDTKLVANNLDASIKYRANDEAVANAKSVKLADGFNYVVSNDATTTAEGPKSGLAITAEDNGKVTFGLDKDTRSKVDNAADKNLSNLSDAGKEKFKELAKDAAKTAVQVAPGINTTVTTDTTTTEGTTIYKVNAIDTTVAVGSDALTINNATPDTNKVRAYSVDLSDATKGKLAAVGNLATVIGGTTIATDGTVTGPTFNITKATGGTDTANTLKDAIEKLDAANQGQNTAITNLGTRITNLVDGGMTFIGDDATADKVARKLGETLNIHGQNNITVKKDGTDATTLNVKLASDLKNITSITNADADNKPGSKITLGADGVSIANTAAGADGVAGDTKTVTISKDGINAGGMKVTNVGKATENGDAANKEYVDNEITKLQTTVTNNANLNFAGNVTKDGQDKAVDKLGLSLATGTLHVNGDNTNIVTTAKGDMITVELAQAVKDQLAKVGDTASNGRDGKDGVSGAKGLTGADGLNNATLNDKVNAIRNGEAGSVVYTNEAGDRVVKAKDGKYYKADEVKADGTVKTADENNGKAPQAIDNPQARVVNGNGDTKAPTTLSNIADGKVAANSKEAVNGGQLHTMKSDLATALGGDSKVNADGSFTGPTYNITKDDGTNTTEEAKTVGDAISKLDSRINNANSSLATKGLDFYGNKDAADTDKVHRNLGETLKVKGAENFKREATATNNIDVVKNTAGDGFDVKLAENLTNIKEVAGNGTDNLVIKNGDATITLKPAKPAVNDPATGDETTPAKQATVDFGDSNVVAKNLDASITYRANNAEDTAANTVKLKKGLNFVAGTGTVAPKNLEAGTASPTATTDGMTPKKGIVISTAENGVVNIGLDNDTRSAIDNAADKADVNAAVTNLDTRISNLVDGGMTFIGDDATADAVTRKLGETLNIHGQNNISVKKDGTDATTLNVKLASDLKNITSITNADADNKPGSKITLGADGVTITNTQAPAVGATTGETKTVTIGKDGIDAGKMNITNVAEAKNDGDATNKQYVDNAINKLGETLTNNATLNFAGNVTKDAQDQDTEKVGLSLAKGTLHVNGDNTNIVTTAKGDTITVELAQAVKDQLAKVGDTASNGRDGKDGVSGAKGLTGADGLNNATLNDKVNALRNGEAGSVVYTNEAGDRVVKAKDGKYYKADEVKADGTVKTADENNGKAPEALDNPQARVVNGNGDTKAPTTLSNIADGKVVANSKEAVNGGQLHTVKSDLATALGGDSKVNADGSFTGPTYNITKDDGSKTTEEAKSVGDAISKLDSRINNANSSLATKGLDFYGNKDTADTDKVHRNLGETLKVKGAENFKREATATNNIDVVKNTAGDGFDVKLAENLGNMKEIAGNGTDDLVIKNGDATITVKPGKAGGTDAGTGTVTPATKPSVDFGDTTLVAKNLDASITYRANDAEDTAANTVKLKKGLNFVAGTGTVAPKAPATDGTNPTADTTTGTSPTATTDSVATKKGIAISTDVDGVVNIGLDSDTRSAIDNAANQDLSNLTSAGKKAITDAAQGAVKVAAGNNVTIGTETKDNVTTYTVNGRDTTVKAAENGSVSVTGGTLNAKGEREYTVDLTDATKAQINRIDGIDTRLTTAEGNITTLQGDMTQAKQDITTLQGDMTKAKADIVTNAGNIATNAGNIATNKANITKNAGDIAINTANITKNAGNITTNATNIGKNAQAIEALQGNSATKDLSNLTNAGKDVVTGLVNVVGTNGITVTNATDDTSRVKTFTAKLDDKVTFGKDGNKITIDGTTGTITAPNATINVVNTNTIQAGDANTTNTAVTPEGVTVTTKQPDGTVTSTVIIKDGTVSGLTNTKWDPTKVTDTDRSKAATQGQVKDVSDTLQKGRVFAADSGVASTTVALGDTLAIKGEAKGALTDHNIGVELTAANGKIPATMTVRLAKNVQMKDGSTSYNYYLPEVITKPDGTKDIAKNADGTVKYQTDKEGNPISIVTTTVNGEGITIAPVKGLNKPSVSVTADGLDNGGNAIHHVGPGTAVDDAATLGQVVAAASAVSRQVNQTGAHAAALAAMNPLSYDPLKKSQVMAGYGAYKGNSALALGVAHYANEDTLFNVGVSVGNGENMVNAGMTYRFGGEDSMIPERYKGGPISSVYVMQDEITALKAENARKDAENAKKDAENEEMKAQIKMLIERVTMLEAKK